MNNKLHYEQTLHELLHFFHAKTYFVAQNLWGMPELCEKTPNMLDTKSFVKTHLRGPPYFSSVFYQITTLLKCFRAPITWERFLTSISSSVYSQVIFKLKWFKALITWERSLTSVGFSVYFRINTLLKCFKVLITWERFLTIKSTLY